MRRSRWALLLKLLIVTGSYANVAWSDDGSANRHLPGIGALKASSSLRMHTQVKSDDMAAFLVADQMDTDTDGKVILQGDAEVRRIDSVAKGDYIDYSRDTGLVRVRGSGVLMREGSIMHSPSFEYNLNEETGVAQYPEFWLGGSGGSGTSEEAKILSKNHMNLKNLQYSGCPCPEPAWYIKSPNVDLYIDENEGIARHGVLYFKNVPILYSPWLSFPIRKERKSGFLMPTVGMSSKSGLDFSLPYYFNLAPNYDLTLTPRYLSKRGAMIGAEFRYLQPSYNGLIEGAYLHSDNQRGIDRWHVKAQHNHRIGSGLSASLRLNRVSDGDYFRDISNMDLAESSQDYLTSSAALRWRPSKYISSSLALVKYQTLQDRTGRYRRPQYDKLPELKLRLSRFNWGGFDVESDNQVTRFRMPKFIGGTHPYPYRNYPYQSYDGVRYKSYNTISYPIVRAGWYLTPKVGLHATHYETEWNSFSAPGIKWVDLGRTTGPRAQSRVLPIASVDAGMTFERDSSFFGNPAIQTLEPRVYYLRIPYKDQSTLPVFDTSLASFNIAQAFSENIFSGGWDRIADANQLTVGLTTRWLEHGTGKERLNITAAQRMYFRDQLVTLNANHNTRTNAKSDYLLGVGAALTDTLNVRFDAQYNPESKKRNRMTAGFRWSPKRLTTISALYRFERDRKALLYYNEPDPLEKNETVSIMAQWPITNKWYGVGRFDYSFTESRSTQSVLGLEYKGECCWAARAVLQRYAVSRKDVNTAIFFQLELSGLGPIGTNAMKVLSDRIAGYRRVTPPLHEQTTFERYE